MSVFERVRQTFCGLHGHDSLLQFAQDKMYLKCVSCGHESPGWEITETPPVTTTTMSVREEVRRARVARPQLVSVRRIA